MNAFFYFSSVLPILVCFSVTVLCVNTDDCYLSDKTKSDEEKKLLDRISSLKGQNFKTDQTNHDGYTYMVTICSDTSSKAHGNDSVTRAKVKGETEVLGRKNDTHLSGGATWVLLRYESGDHVNDSQCLGQRKASVYIVCDADDHDDPPNLQLAEVDACSYKFVLPSSVVCEHNEELSGSTIFFIIIIVALCVYFIIGILYRRFVYNAQRCQQLPHFAFWSKFGGMLADGCNYACRCDAENEDSWNNITSNFDNTDRDDALLRP